MFYCIRAQSWSLVHTKGIFQRMSCSDKQRKRFVRSQKLRLTTFPDCQYSLGGRPLHLDCNKRNDKKPPQKKLFIQQRATLEMRTSRGHRTNYSLIRKHVQNFWGSFHKVLKQFSGKEVRRDVSKKKFFFYSQHIIK